MDQDQEPVKTDDAAEVPASASAADAGQPLAPLTAAVFDDLIAALGEIRDEYLLNPERFNTTLDAVEGFRYVGQVLSAASEMFYEADPERPRFISIVTPERKLQGDNPDAIYHFARIQGDRAYKVTGRIEEQCYTSFTVHGPADDGGMAGPLLGDLNDRDFNVADDGTYEVTFGGDQQDGNWFALDPAAHAIIVRSYYQLPRSAQVNPNIAVNIHIAAVDAPPPPPPLDDATFAGRMAEGLAFIRQVTLAQRMPSDRSEVPFVSNTPNHLPEPFSFRDTGLPVPGAADIFYCMGRWELGPDEALVMTGTLPEGPFTNVMLWNAHMQTLDYADHQSSLNRSQIATEEDGSYRIVLSSRDPGVPNWLDTDGHPRGSIFWRFLLPETDPPQPQCEVVPVDSLST